MSIFQRGHNSQDFSLVSRIFSVIISVNYCFSNYAELTLFHAGMFFLFQSIPFFKIFVGSRSAPVRFCFQKFCWSTSTPTFWFPGSHLVIVIFPKCVYNITISKSWGWVSNIPVSDIPVSNILVIIRKVIIYKRWGSVSNIPVSDMWLSF